MGNRLRQSRNRLVERVSLLALLGLASAPTADAASSSSGEEYLSVTEAVEPNIVFLIDLSTSMDDPCPDDSSSDSGDTGSSSGFTDPCIDDVLDAIDQVTQHFDFARYGLVGTSDDSTYGDEFYPLIPLGTPPSEFSTALSSVSANSTTTANFGEALAALSHDYFENTTTDDGVDDDGDGFDNDWDEAPVEYWCQETHVIVITGQRPANDDQISSAYQGSIGTDVTCTAAARTTTGSDTQCLYDNVAYSLYSDDLRSDLSGDQNVTVHTVGLGVPSTAIAEELYGNASDQIGGAGLYTVADESDEILAGILTIIQDIRAGTYSRSTPVVSAEGDYLVYTYYELAGDDSAGATTGVALGQGHIRAYEIDQDPTSSSYGQVLYDGPSEFGGALWDGGTLLVSRLVTAKESNPDDMDGFGRRDIYTFFEPAVSLSALSSEATGDKRMGFDLEFVDEVYADSAVLDYLLDETDDTYDLDDDGDHDQDDLHALVDFVRGENNTEFRYLDQGRGRWRLGDSPHSVPTIVEARNKNHASDPTYRKFLRELEANRDAGTNPDIVLLAANDGMLHAFQLEDDAGTSDTEEGEELWAWVPGYLLEREHDAEWAGRLVDMMLYGRTFLFDGSPVVEDVWIDYNDDGAKDCNSVPDDCEYRRVVVVQQGKGGPVTLALDITDTNSPQFLWEQTDETVNTATGYTVSRPVIGAIYDNSDPSDPRDRWMAFWGSGRAVPYSSTTSTYYETAEANLYMWHVGDDYWGSANTAIQDTAGAGHARGANMHPESDIYGSSTLDTDGDAAGHYEYAYISAALAAVDVDSDGDVDTIYFPVTTAYSPTDEGGGGPGDVVDPGSTWMYKACVDTDNPGELTFIEFFDPVDDGGLSDTSGDGTRPEVYYSATTSWLNDGGLGVYWGTGTPYDRTGSEAGYFFSMKDTAPADCSADYMTPMTDCPASGVKTLDSGEGLTSEPVVYSGTVYFSTWVPDSDRCDGGVGRLYGIDFEDCSSSIDTDGSGEVDSDDDDYVEEDAYISGLTVTEQGSLFYGTSDVVTDGSGDAVGSLEAADNDFLGTATLGWMEMF